MSLKEIQLAALLHDIGKFSKRAKEAPDPWYRKLSKEDHGFSGAHAKWSASFIREFNLGSVIEDLVLYHHNPSHSRYQEFSKIVQKTDHHSSMERTESKKRDVKKEPLISVFSKVSITEDNKPQEYYLPLHELNVDSLDTVKPKPVKKETMSGWNLELEYKKLWKGFKGEFNSLKNPKNFNTVLYLLKKYTSLIPAAAYVRDISLFDHLKTSAALATCMYLQENKLKFSENYYLVVSGDISGIQNFIYRISSPQEAQKGMSKRLRGRSLYLNLINDAVLSRIIKDLELTWANILFCGGGHFIAIVPNTSHAMEKLGEIKSEINHLFLDKFNAELYLALSTVSCSGSDLENFGKIMEKLTHGNLKEKRSKFQGFLDKIFQDETEIPYNTCPVCGGENQNEEGFCKECLNHEKLGRKIANAEYIIKAYTTDKKAFDFHEMGVGYKFESKGNKLVDRIKSMSSRFEKVEVFRLNDSNFLEMVDELGDLENVSFGFSFMGNTVPRHFDKGTLYFEHLAEISKGAKKLGILRMDVDNLGKIFSSGLNNPSISRISTLSSFLDMFFSGFINLIAKKYRVWGDVCPQCRDLVEEIGIKFDANSKEVKIYREIEGNVVCRECMKNSIPTIYINYSGGDDLLVFGPYDDIIRFSNDLKDEFKDWTCLNRDITLSAGIFLAGSKFPVDRAVNFACNYLETSKNCGKDKITVFNDVVRWDTQEPYKGFKDLLDFAYKLEDLSNSGKISKSLVYSMLMMWQDTFTIFKPANNIKEWNKNNKVRLEKKKYVPLFKYKLRTVKNHQIKEEMNKEGLKFMPWIKIPASWVSLRTR
ncbi:MAG: type III-A CRISPR-associated protein Cas10/Csm1 [Methanobacteriaceae archaeon]|jgi:CRISPR-associated protein Csm1